MNEKNTGGPAFPGIHEWKEPDIGDPDTGETLTWSHRAAHVGGMTLRDYFAAKALPAMIIQLGNHLPDQATNEHFAELSYSMADAMIEARDK